MQDQLIPTLLVCQFADDQVEVAKNYIKQLQNITQQEEKFLDIIWTNQAFETIKIDDIRDTIYQLQFARFNDQQRFWIILMADRLTLPAQNSLLKVLEDNPNGTKIILVTSKPGKLLPTIQSRCLEKLVDSVNENERENKNEGKSRNERKVDPKYVQIYQQLPTLSVSAIFDFSQTYKDRTEAITLLNNLIAVAHSQPTTISSVNHLKWLLEGIDLLEKNVNVRQVLEHVCFKFSNKFSDFF